MAWCWSDAEYDQQRPELGGGLGYVLMRDTRVVAGACRVPADVIKSFLPRKQQIGQLEALVPYVAMCNHPEMLRGVDAMWGIDNTSAEASLIRGYSSKGDTANLVAATHLVMADLDMRTYWFHVDSESNPSDGLSRDGLEDEWTCQMARQYQWQLCEAALPPLKQWENLPFQMLVQSMVATMGERKGRHGVYSNIRRWEQPALAQQLRCFTYP